MKPDVWADYNQTDDDGHVAGISANGVVALDVDWESQPTSGRATSATA